MDKNIELSISGGGAKGTSVIAILEALEAEGINIKAISGASIGSILAMLYAYTKDAKLTKRYVLDGLSLFNEKSDDLNFSKIRAAAKGILGPEDGLINSQILYEFIKHYLDNIGLTSLNTLKIPFAAPAVDLLSGETLIFSNDPDYFKQNLRGITYFRGKIEPAKVLTSSSAMAAIFSSFEFGPYRFTDGGTILSVPSILHNRDENTKLLTINYDYMHAVYSSENNDIEDTAVRALGLMKSSLEDDQALHADYTIKIPCNYTSFDFDKSILTYEETREWLEEAGGLKAVVREL